MFLSNKSVKPNNIRCQSYPKKINKLKKTAIQTAGLDKNSSITQAQAYCRIYLNFWRSLECLHTLGVLPELYAQGSCKAKKKNHLVLN